jgi:hypothetical protein
MEEFKPQPLPTSAIAGTVDGLISILRPEEALQSIVRDQITIELSKVYPQVAVIYNKHYYYVFLNLNWFSYLILWIFSLRSLKRDILAEVGEIDPKVRGLSFYNRLSNQAAGFIK